MKLWAMPSRATQDGRVIVESSDKTWSAGGGNGKPLQYSCRENPMNCIKRQKIVTPKDEPSMLEGVQYATGGERRTITNSSRKNEAACWEGTFSLYSKWYYTLETLTEKAPSHGNLLQSQPEEVSIPAHISQVDPTVWDAEVPGKATNLLPVQSLLNPMLITHARDSDTWGPKRYPASNNQVLKIWAMTLPFGQFICVRQKPTLGPWKESPCLQQFCL